MRKIGTKNRSPFAGNYFAPGAVSCRANPQTTMIQHTLLLSKLYDTFTFGGGIILAYLFSILLTIEIVYVFIKYVIPSNK